MGKGREGIRGSRGVRGRGEDGVGGLRQNRLVQKIVTSLRS